MANKAQPLPSASLAFNPRMESPEDEGSNPNKSVLLSSGNHKPVADKRKSKILKKRIRKSDKKGHKTQPQTQQPGISDSSTLSSGTDSSAFSSSGTDSSMVGPSSSTFFPGSQDTSLRTILKELGAGSTTSLPNQMMDSCSSDFYDRQYRTSAATTTSPGPAVDTKGLEQQCHLKNGPAETRALD